jgi:hypothetical protein
MPDERQLNLTMIWANLIPAPATFNRFLSQMESRWKHIAARLQTVVYANYIVQYADNLRVFDGRAVP